MGADVRRERAHDPLELDRRPRRIELAVLGRDLVRVRGVRLVLRGAGRRLVERPDEQLAAELLQARRERAVRVLGGDRLGAPGRNRSAVEPRATRMIETPVTSSPAMIARSTGAAPRQRGSSDGCTFSIG